MSFENILTKIITDPDNGKTGKVEIAEWTGDHKSYHVVLSGDITIDGSGFWFNDSIGVTKEVMEIIRTYDHGEINVTLIHQDGEEEHLGKLINWSMAKGIYKFYYLLF